MLRFHLIVSHAKESIEDKFLQHRKCGINYWPGRILVRWT